MTSVPDRDASALEGATARATIWFGLATAGVKLISFASMFVLARVLDHGEFGVASYALTLGALFEGVTGLGAGAAAIQFPTSRASSDASPPCGWWRPSPCPPPSGSPWWRSPW